MGSDVIEVQKTHLPRQATQNPFHQPLKRGRGIAKPEGHDSELVKPTPGGERCFGSVSNIHFDLTIASRKIKGAKPTGARQGVDGIIYAWEWLGVLHRGRI